MPPAATAQALVAELEREAAATRRMLERVPEERLDWRPHESSMTLGELALHVAAVPGQAAGLLQREEVEVPDFREVPAPSSREQILEAFEESLRTAREVLAGMDEATAAGEWRMVRQGRVLLALPRIGLARAVLLNHWYHHRGQLSVYLRLLDVPLPPVYGPTADENPFA